MDALDPRVERTRRVVLDATIQLLVEGGYGAVTIEAVAARSGVAKSTIYRHWPGRLELVRDAFHELKPQVPLPSEGSVCDRIVTMLEQLAANVADSTWSLCLPALIDAAERDPEARDLHQGLARAGRQALHDLVQEGIESGEFDPRLDPELMAEALVGPIMLRRLMAAEPLPPEKVRPFVEQLLRR